jgi:acyl-CoA synthetase (AMP-forming)/AMP-acid ligase II
MVKGVPSHFDSLLGQLPADMPRPGALTLDCGGGTLSSSLRDRLRQRLSDEIRVAYGSTETGSIARANIDIVTGADEVVGSVLPWMRAEVLGEDGSVLPQGETGEIRIAGEDVVDGYFESPEDTARYFRDGWFHPGDLGYIDGHGNLVVTGRIDDLMNLGGAKILPSRAEAIVLNIPGIDDAAAFAVASERDQPTLWIAYCGPAPVDAELIRTALPAFPRVQVVRLPAIPRNPMGRIERAALRDQAQRDLLVGLAS